MKDYSVLIKCGTTSPEQLASVLLRMKFYPDDYRHTLARLLEGCDAIIDQSAETPSPASPAHSPTHTPNPDLANAARLLISAIDDASPESVTDEAFQAITDAAAVLEQVLKGGLK